MRLSVAVLTGALVTTLAVSLVASVGNRHAAARASTLQEKAASRARTDVMTLNQTSPQRPDKVVRTDEEWRKLLTKEQYDILRGHGTERPFCGINLEDQGEGAYHCVGCDLPLFKAQKKFNSGTGWPSYTEPATDDAVWYRQDRSYGMVRTEVLCARCDGHLGHVFDDGPNPDTLRYCINGTVLKFVPAKR
jgi:peptide-methionine (R)-S-oxide reductase